MSGRAVLLTVPGILMAVLMTATSASAQPRATAFLSPVEGGSWSLTVEPTAPAPTGARERICLHPGLYVVAVRIERGYGGMVRVGELDAEAVIAEMFLSSMAGERWGWSSFSVGGGRRCFEVGMVVEAFTDRALRGPALRLQVYGVRVGVDW